MHMFVCCRACEGLVTIHMVVLHVKAWLPCTCSFVAVHVKIWLPYTWVVPVHVKIWLPYTCWFGCCACEGVVTMHMLV